MANTDRLKLKFTTWYCDKEPYGFVEFMQATTAVMRSIDHGNEVEDYLDIKLDRVRHVDMMVSSIIDDDPDFFDPTDGVNTDANLSSASSNVATSGASTRGSVLSVETVQASQSQSSMILKSAGPYQNFSEGARALDLMMYSVLITNVIRSKHVILECTNKPSHIQGICLLYKHCDITRNHRISQAFANMDSLSYMAEMHKCGPRIQLGE